MAIAPEILALDFASLRTLRLVYRLGSFTSAAANLGMNTSSISYTIERVRKATGDPLFVRQGGELAATDHCHQLMLSVDRILEESENFRDDMDFEPLHAVGEISVNMSSYERVLVLPSIVKRLRNEAPGIRLIFKESYGAAKEMLLDGTTDIYLGPQKISDSGIYGKETIVRDHHLCMMDPKHPLAKKSKLTLDDIKDANHAHFEPRPGWQQAPLRFAYSKGVELNKVVISGDAPSFGYIIVGTDLLAALPSRMAIQFDDSLTILPFDFDTGMAQHIYWTASTHRSKLNRWVRSVIEEEALSLLQPTVAE